MIFKKHIREATPYVGGSTRSDAAAGALAHKLSSNENMLGPSPLAVKAIEKALPQLFEYNYQDDQLLREAIAASLGDDISPGQIVPANSGMELLDMICRAFLEPGDECIISTPTFLAFKSFSALSGACVKDVPLNPRNHALDIDGILQATNNRTRIVFVSSPNNPTGSIVLKEELEQLLEALPEDCLVVYDEVYHHYVSHFGYARALDFIKEGHPVIGIHSFSKAYGLAGIRLGYAFSTPQIAGYLSQLRRPFMINTLAVEAGMAALLDHQHIEKTISLVEEEKRWLYRQFGEIGIRYWPGHANFILIESPYEPRHVAADLLSAGVMVRTGDVFGAPGTIRVTIGTRIANTAFIKMLKLLI